VFRGAAPFTKILIVAMCGLAAPLSAQVDLDVDPAKRPAPLNTPTVAPVAPAAAASPRTPLARPTALPPPSSASVDAREQLAAVWRQGQDAKDRDRARRSLLELDEALLDAGVPGLSGGVQARAMAIALMRDAAQAQTDGRTGDAQELVEVARHAAPDATTVQMMIAEQGWRSNDFGLLVGGLRGALKAMANDPLVLSNVLALAMLATGVALLLLLFTLTLLLSVRQLKHLAYDLWLSMPAGVAPWQMVAVVVVAAVAPWLLGVGVVYACLVVMTLSFAYLKRSAQLACAVVLLALIPAPFVVHLFARLHAMPGSSHALVHDATYELDADDQRAWLAKAAELDPRAALAIALDDKRHGRIDMARDQLRRAIVLAPQDPILQANHGVLSALSNNFDVAEVAMRGALDSLTDGEAADPQAARLVRFNLQLLHQRRGEDTPIVGLDDDADLRRATFRAGKDVASLGRAYVDVLPHPRHALSADLWGHPAPPATSWVESSAADALFGGLQRGFASAVLVLFGVVWLVLRAWSKRVRLSSSCERCGHSASKRVGDKMVPTNICAGCYHTFLAKPSTVSPDARKSKERSIQITRVIRSRAIVLAAVAFPGAGHLAGGNLRTGLWLFFAALGVVFAAAMMTFGLGTWASPRVTTDGFSGWVWLLAVPFGVLWLLSLRGAFDLAADAAEGP
jgi:hypothetical protein